MIKIYSFIVTTFNEDGSIHSHKNAKGEDFGKLINLIEKDTQINLDTVKVSPVWKKHVTGKGTLVQFLGSHAIKI